MQWRVRGTRPCGAAVPRRSREAPGIAQAARGTRAQGGQTAAEGPALERAHVARPGTTRAACGMRPRLPVMPAAAAGVPVCGDCAPCVDLRGPRPLHDNTAIQPRDGPGEGSGNDLQGNPFRIDDRRNPEWQPRATRVRNESELRFIHPTTLFTHNSVNYTIAALAYDTNSGEVWVALDKALPGGFALKLGSRRVAGLAYMIEQSLHLYSAPMPNPGWGSGSTVAVELFPAQTVALVPGGAQRAQSMESEILTPRLETVPNSHDGTSPFTVRLGSARPSQRAPNRCAITCSPSRAGQ